MERLSLAIVWWSALGGVMVGTGVGWRLATLLRVERRPLGDSALAVECDELRARNELVEKKLHRALDVLLG